MDDRRVANYLFLFFLFLYILFSSLRIDSGDGETMYRVAYSMVTTRSFAIPVEPLTQDIIGPWGQILPVELFEGGTVTAYGDETGFITPNMVWAGRWLQPLYVFWV